MSNEAMIGIVITVIFGVGGLLLTTKKNKVSVKNKNGIVNMKDNIIGNEININKDKK